MNCVLWSPKYPRTIPNDLIRNIWAQSPTLLGIGDITCDPEGSIEFSRETWIDDPVYVYDPIEGTFRTGFTGKGIAVMAIANLPCEFSSDASSKFAEDLAPLVANIILADFDAPLIESGLNDALQRATLLWNGKLTPRYAYMQEYIDSAPS